VGFGSVASIGSFVYRRRQTGAAATTSTDTTATDTSGQIDPATGDIAGSAQDQMDLAALQDGGYGSGSYGSGGFGNYGGYLAATPAAATIPGAGGFTTNGEWAQQAETDLGGLGINQATLAAALGNYLTGRALSTAQQSLVDQAIAEEGYPPVSGPGGYPPAMKTSATGPGGGPGTKVKVPNVVGRTVNAAHEALTDAGLAYNADTAKDKHGYERKVTAEHPKAGTSVAKGTHVGLTWHYAKT
ncbi:MAG: hypothetical protein JWO67_2249, partial [Streptosporangiaceae bacterium]|nr:hypothetical protein [Streptosporangiaceae bacterium]